MAALRWQNFWPLQQDEHLLWEGQPVVWRYCVPWAVGLGAAALLLSPLAVAKYQMRHGDHWLHGWLSVMGPMFLLCFARLIEPISYAWNRRYAVTNKRVLILGPTPRGPWRCEEFLVADVRPGLDRKGFGTGIITFGWDVKHETLAFEYITGAEQVRDLIREAQTRRPEAEREAARRNFYVPHRSVDYQSIGVPPGEAIVWQGQPSLKSGTLTPLLLVAVLFLMTPFGALLPHSIGWPLFLAGMAVVMVCLTLATYRLDLNRRTRYVVTEWRARVVRLGPGLPRYREIQLTENSTVRFQRHWLIGGKLVFEARETGEAEQLAFPAPAHIKKAFEEITAARTRRQAA